MRESVSDRGGDESYFASSSPACVVGSHILPLVNGSFSIITETLERLEYVWRGNTLFARGYRQVEVDYVPIRRWCPSWLWPFSSTPTSPPEPLDDGRLTTTISIDGDGKVKRDQAMKLQMEADQPHFTSTERMSTTKAAKPTGYLQWKKIEEELPSFRPVPISFWLSIFIDLFITVLAIYMPAQVQVLNIVPTVAIWVWLVYLGMREKEVSKRFHGYPLNYVVSFNTSCIDVYMNEGINECVYVRMYVCKQRRACACLNAQKSFPPFNVPRPSLPSLIRPSHHPFHLFFPLCPFPFFSLLSPPPERTARPEM